MALPKPQLPIFTTTIPSTGQLVQYRGFTVREEKVLLLAQETEDTNTIVQATKQVVQLCIANDVDVSKLAHFDVEYLLTMIRAKSVGEVVELALPCDQDGTHPRTLVNIDVSKLQVVFPEKHTRQIALYDDVGVTMRYPTIDEISRFDSMDGLVATAACVESIYTADEVFDAKDQTIEEVVDFLSSLTKSQLQKIDENFFATMPSFSHIVEYKCSACGHQHKKLVKGIASFFV